MGMNLTQAVSRVAKRLNKNANDTVVYDRIKNHINDACQEKWGGYAWSFRYRDYPLVTTPRVMSGTLTATSGSGTVTASGTPFLSASHIGAWIRFTADGTEAWYRIKSISSTSVALMEPVYQGTTGSLKAYELIPTDYLLATEISDVGTMKVMYGRYTIKLSHQLMSDMYDQPPTSSGSPDRATILNQSQVKSTYTTGTLSGSLNGMVLTGVGTSWLGNVKEGDGIVIGTTDTNTYTVYSIDSDTQLTIYNCLASAPSGASYIITRQFGKLLRLLPGSDQPYVLFVKALRKYTALVSTIDTNELLDRFPSAVIESAVWREAGSSPDPREDSIYMKSEAMWSRAQGEDEQIMPHQNYQPIFNPRVRY